MHRVAKTNRKISDTYRHHKALEAAARRLSRHATIGACVSAAVLLLSIFVMSAVLGVPLLVAIAVCVLPAIWMERYLRARTVTIRSLVRDQLCPVCGYCVLHSPGDGACVVCSECGHAFERRLFRPPARGYMGGSLDDLVDSDSGCEKP